MRGVSRMFVALALCAGLVGCGTQAGGVATFAQSGNKVSEQTVGDVTQTMTDDAAAHMEED